MRKVVFRYVINTRPGGSIPRSWAGSPGSPGRFLGSVFIGFHWFLAASMVVEEDGRLVLQVGLVQHSELLQGRLVLGLRVPGESGGEGGGAGAAPGHVEGVGGPGSNLEDVQTVHTVHHGTVC